MVLKGSLLITAFVVFVWRNDFSHQGFVKMLAYLPNESILLLLLDGFYVFRRTADIPVRFFNPFGRGCMEGWTIWIVSSIAFTEAFRLSFISGFRGEATSTIYVMAGTEKLEKLCTFERKLIILTAYPICWRCIFRKKRKLSFLHNSACRDGPKKVIILLSHPASPYKTEH